MKLKAIVVGLGRMGAEPSIRINEWAREGWMPVSHAEAILSSNIELIGLCDVDQSKCSHFGAMYDVKNTYNNYQDAILELKPDIVTIATRTDIRPEVMQFAIENGVKGIYAEKPLSQSISICENILSNIQNHNVKIVYGATRRAMDVYKKAKEIAWSGELGNIIEINANFGYSKLLWTQPHAADLITFFANDTQIEHIQGYCTIKADSISDSKIDDDPLIENAYLQFSNGISATIVKGNGSNLQINCTKGHLTVHGDGSFIEIYKPTTTHYYFDLVKKMKVKAKFSGTQYLMTDLRDAILEDKKVEHIKPEEILCGQKILFGIVESTLKGGRRIKPSAIRKDLIITGKTGVNIA